jgi:hypothetical protein
LRASRRARPHPGQVLESLKFKQPAGVLALANSGGGRPRAGNRVSFARTRLPSASMSPETDWVDVAGSWAVPLGGVGQQPAGQRPVPVPVAPACVAAVWGLYMLSVGSPPLHTSFVHPSVAHSWYMSIVGGDVWGANGDSCSRGPRSVCPTGY